MDVCLCSPLQTVIKRSSNKYGRVGVYVENATQLEYKLRRKVQNLRGSAGWCKLLNNLPWCNIEYQSMLDRADALETALGNPPQI